MRFLAYLFVAFYISVSTGISFNIHFCKGLIESVTLIGSSNCIKHEVCEITTVKTVDCCKKAENLPKDCCENQEKEIQFLPYNSLVYDFIYEIKPIAGFLANCENTAPLKLVVKQNT